MVAYAGATAIDAVPMDMSPKVKINRIIITGNKVTRDKVIRRELKVPTTFNFLGPLTNPARPFAQVIGVAEARMLPLIANVLARRGTTATVFQGLDGLDELSLTMPSVVYEVRDHDVRKRTFDPDDFGLEHAKAADLRGGDAAQNADIARAILGGEKGPRRDIVLLNAAAALEVAGKAGSLVDGIGQAAESIDSGAAAAKLDRCRGFAGRRIVSFRHSRHDRVASAP